MLEKFKEQIHKYDLTTKSIIIATSGGVDSIVLCHLAHKCRLDFAIAHCNFHLRGDESDSDEQLVKELAQKLDVDYFHKDFHTKQLLSGSRESLQMLARRLRYEWFEELIGAYKYTTLFTAHHLNDSIENFYSNSIRGTGLDGLTGIPEVNNHIVRPLLFTSKKVIYDYANNNQLKWREDKSNESNKYKRNLIRNEIIPLFSKLNPGFEETFSSTFSRLKDARSIIEHTVDEFEKKACKVAGDRLIIDKTMLKNTPGNTLILFHILKHKGFQYKICDQIVRSLDNTPGIRFNSEAFQLIVDRSELFVTVRQQKKIQRELIQYGEELFQNGVFELRLQVQEFSGHIDPNPFIALLDLDSLQFPLEVRQWNQGDQFVPLGMKHKKKLSDFLIDAKIPVNEKNHIGVLISNDEICWVIGKRLSDHFKVKEDTTQVLKIEFKQLSR